MTRKWFTCTPVRFVGDRTFFARDSGLLCKGFQEIGIECKAIMPGPPMEVDQTEDLIRTDYRNLEDPEWWKSLGGEGVVFYGWGSGKYVRIVRAIKESGLFLVSHMDTAGMLGVFNGLGEFSGNLWRVTMGEATHPLPGILRFAARLAYGCSVAVLRNDISRAQHLKQADIIGAISPIALERIRKVCRIYGSEELAARVQLVPHPNASYMSWDPSIPKERLIVAVGRWDDAKVKGTALLMQVSELCTIRDSSLSFEIYGHPSQGMRVWHDKLSPDLRERIHLMGIVPNTDVMKAYQRARISLCTSLREGYHTASAEAMCCGCSVVGPDVPEIPSMKWFACGESGRMAARNAESMAQAVWEENREWNKNARNPKVISDNWSAQLHSNRVALLILHTSLNFKR
jgi:glycosyltransferase involved in cell wall biosynthesis